jgi:hypothetical protein
MMHEEGVVGCERLARFILNSSGAIKLILGPLITIQCRMGAALAFPLPPFQFQALPGESKHRVQP